MNRSRFVATRLTLSQANDVWAQSDEATAFTRPDYLAQLVDEIDWWGVERSGEVAAAWPLVRAVAEGEIGPPAFCYYVGPMFVRSLREDKYLRYWTAYTETLSALVEALVSTYPRFRFSLPIGLHDVRPFEWWNFDHPDGSAFTVTPRYTARIDQREFLDEDALYSSFAHGRQHEIRLWSANPPTVSYDVSAERVIELHDQALTRNGGPCDEQRHTALRRMIRLIQSGAGSIIALAPDDPTRVEAVILTLDGLNESNDILSVASDTGRRSGLTVWARWQGLLRARSIGKRWFDFNGANSPGRAADKHFYGAHTELYFNGCFERL